MPIKTVEECGRCGGDNINHTYRGYTPVAICEDCQWWTHTWQSSGKRTCRCRSCGATQSGGGACQQCESHKVWPDSEQERMRAGVNCRRGNTKITH